MLKWINEIPFHQEFRYQYTLLKKPTISDNKFSFDKITKSYHQFLLELESLRKVSFEPDYRRRNNDFRIQFLPQLTVEAYAKPEHEGVAFISQGLVMAIEDACQVISSDVRSTFALNVDDNNFQEKNVSPSVLFDSKGGAYDFNRFWNYEQFVHAAQLIKEPKLALCSTHKMISTSGFRQELGDFLSTMSLLWVIAHEDAHFFLGHVKYFNDRLGSHSNDKSYFQEFINNYSDPSLNRLRLSAEISADSNASYNLVDHVFDDHIYNIHPFLHKHLEYSKPLSAHSYDSQKTTYLFRLMVVSVVITLCVFERNVIKSQSLNQGYPSLSKRIINAVIDVFHRCMVVGHRKEHGRNMTIKMSDWIDVIGSLGKEINIIMRHIFEQGFTINDSQIHKRRVEDVIGNELPDQLFKDLGLFIIYTEYKPWKAKELVSSSTLLKEYLEYKCESISSGMYEFLGTRIEVNKNRGHKIAESVKYETQQFELFSMILND